jgi:hypothetical protein
MDPSVGQPEQQKATKEGIKRRIFLSSIDAYIQHDFEIVHLF